MSRKHNTKHLRGRSRYPERLKQRGTAPKYVRMASLDELRNRAARTTHRADCTLTPCRTDYVYDS